MVQTKVKQTKKVDMSVLLPSEYVGKEVHVLFYIDEEISLTSSTIKNKKKPSDYFGSLSREEGEKMQKFVLESRKEWQ